ncbi:MAG: hypothetical protein ABFR36_01190 [Acidobacteriota bacterium]
MRKIEYNISSSKSIDLRFFIISICIVLFLSIFFIYIGINNISGINVNLKEEVDKKNYYDNELQKIKDNEKLFGERIGKIKGDWNTRVRFANTVINAKAFPFLKWLNYFENILPDMVEINDILLDSGLKGDVVLTVSSYSTEKLYEFYKKMIGNNLVIASESENNGIFKSKLRVTLKK